MSDTRREEFAAWRMRHRFDGDPTNTEFMIWRMMKDEEVKRHEPKTYLPALSNDELALYASNNHATPLEAEMSHRMRELVDIETRATRMNDIVYDLAHDNRTGMEVSERLLDALEAYEEVA